MNGHKLSGTRQWNKHWQNGEGVGTVVPTPTPPIPPEPEDDFGNNFQNIIGVAITAIKYEGSLGYEMLSSVAYGMYFLLNDNRIYFDFTTMHSYYITHHGTTDYVLAIPKGLIINFKNNCSFSSDKMFEEGVFHNITITEDTLDYYGIEIPFYALRFDQETNYEDRYIEYDFDPQSVNKNSIINIGYYVQSPDNTVKTGEVIASWNIKTKPYKLNYNNHDVGTYKLVFEKEMSPEMIVKKQYCRCWLFNFVRLINSEYRSYDLNNLYYSDGSLTFAGSDYVYYEDVLNNGTNSWSSYTASLGKPIVITTEGSVVDYTSLYMGAQGNASTGYYDLLERKYKVNYKNAPVHNQDEPVQYIGGMIFLNMRGSSSENLFSKITLNNTGV